MNRVMKDSGIEWIGEIPKSWQIIPFKRLGAPLTGSTPSKSRQDYWNGSIPWVSSKDMKSDYILDSEDHITQKAVDECGLAVFNPGTLIFCVRSGILRHTFPVSVSLVPVTINQDLRALSLSEEVNPAFVLYYIRGMNDTVVNLYQKIGATVESIEMDWFLYFPVVLPPLDEQNQIVELLDKKCAEIDSLIVAKEKTNSLLKEWRQSIIYEAVTKGLDPSVPMKDSGIEWIGEIPENWNVERLKYHALFNPITPIPDLIDESPVSFIPMEHLKSGFHLQTESVYSKVKKGYVVFREEDILMAKVTPCLENGNLAIATGLINGIGFGSTEINVIRCLSISNKYLFYLLQCPSYIEKASYNMFGVAGLKRLDPQFIPYSFFPVPPQEDQLIISDFLDKKCDEIDAAIKTNNASIQKLKEYRQSLIYEVVTGKIEIS